METFWIIFLPLGGLVALAFAWRWWSKIENDFVKTPLTVVIEKTSTGYSCYCKEIEGLFAVEDNIPALKEQFHEAFVIMLNYHDEIFGEYANMYPSDFEITYIEE